ncbi:MAG: hypothetical protein QM737_00520 [Ferruginibacter sp.]
MKYISKMNKISFLLAISAMMILSACNKELEQFPEAAPTPYPTGNALGKVLASNPDDSLFLALIERAGLLSTINNDTATFTMYVPNNTAMRQFVVAVAGGAVSPGDPDAVFSGFIRNFFPADQAYAVAGYNIVPQLLPIAAVTSDFPNLQYPSIVNPAPTLSDLLRLTTFPTTRNGAWVNNVPLTDAAGTSATNGIVYNTLALVAPPQRFLWDRINTDTNLEYLKAAILRADSGIVPGPPNGVPTTLQGACESIGANLTILAPTDAAFQTALTGAIYQAVLPLITQQLTAYYISLGMTPADAAAQAAIDAPGYAMTQATTLASSPDVFSNTQLYPYLTARTVQGIVSYHILGSRAFTNNFPTDVTLYPTLLNQGLPTHPGVGLQATFSVPFVTDATVKGLYNSTPANIILNAQPLTPDPYGTCDQHFVNGTLHEIDQVLLPLPL